MDVNWTEIREKGFIDEVIDPALTRKKLIFAFEALENKHEPLCLLRNSLFLKAQ